MLTQEKRVEQKIKKLEEFLHSKDGEKWMKENNERIIKDHQEKGELFSREEQKIWSIYL